MAGDGKRGRENRVKRGGEEVGEHMMIIGEEKRDGTRGKKVEEHYTIGTDNGECGLFNTGTGRCVP